MTNYHHYHYQFYGHQYRRNDLKSTWSFECTCPRCRDPTESGTLVSGVLCEECKDGYMLPVKSECFNSFWKCGACGEKVSGSFIETKVSFENIL